MATAAAYIRVSTEEQALEGISLAAQEDAIHAYCELRGLTLTRLVTDEGISGGKPLSSRPGGEQLLHALRYRKVQAVVATKLDRLFRNCQDCLEVTAQWDRLGISLHLLDLGGQAIDTSSAMGRFFLTVMGGAAEMERNLVRERTIAALAHKKAQGQRVGRVPYGSRLALDGVHLEPDPDEQIVIARIMELREMDHSLRAITKYLNTEGIPARGSRWHKTTVQRIIRRAEAGGFVIPTGYSCIHGVSHAREPHCPSPPPRAIAAG